MLTQSVRRYSAGALLLLLGGLVLLMMAALGGSFDGQVVVLPPAPEEMPLRPRMHGVHLFEDLGNGVTLRLEAAAIEPAPGKIGVFVSWLRPILAVTEARVVVDGPTGERVIITGRECSLSKDGRALTFDRRVQWHRTDQGRVYACRRLELNLDDQKVVFGRGLQLQSPERTTWQPFEIHGFFSPFPPPTDDQAEETRHPSGVPAPK